jgi:hypothetical protein
MKLTIDISVFVADTLSWGRVWGSAEFPEVPAIGATVSFAIPLKKAVPLPDGFTAELRVDSVVFRPNVKDETAVMLFLEDLVLESTEQADAVTKYLEQSFGLFVDKYVDDGPASRPEA